jgi:Fic family protein
MKNKPPYRITPLVLSLIAQISREFGVLSGAKLRTVPMKLRRQNAIRSIQSSLAIEGNRLSIEQVSDIFDGKRVLGPQKDIQEVRNAIELYGLLSQLNPLSLTDFKKAHKILMQGLIDHNGVWRKGGIAVYKGAEPIHVAPQAKMVPELMDQLFEYIKKDKETSWLIKASVFHYELEFIHPFADGNGRMGRLWQQLLLMKEDAIFEILPVESLIKENQERYYDVLAACDKAADSTLFVEFSLECILKALREFTQSSVASVQDFRSRLVLFQSEKKSGWFSRKEYILFHKDISTATASRDLMLGMQEKLLEKRGEKNQTEYRFVN